METRPSLYVGTYKKYNSGSLEGAWVDLTEFANAEEFYDFCRELHKDEDDPEFMFQAYQGFPERLYGENCDVSRIYEVLSHSEDERDIIEEYWDEVSSSVAPGDILDDLMYEGDFEDFAREQAEEMLAESNADDFLRQYFDYEAFARDLELDYHITTHYVFY